MKEKIMEELVLEMLEMLVEMKADVKIIKDTVNRIEKTQIHKKSLRYTSK